MLIPPFQYHQSLRRPRHAGKTLAFICALATLPAAQVWAGTVTSTEASQPSLNLAVQNEALLHHQSLHLQASLHEEQGEYAEAMALYLESYKSLPATESVATLRQSARDGYSRSAVHRARELGKQGNFIEAQNLLEFVLADTFDPQNKAALRLRNDLQDPEKFEPAMSPQHAQNTQQVTALLRDAYSLINLADYDKAIAKFQDVLRIDRYNNAARRGMELAEKHRSNYFRQARDTARAKAFNEINAAWESPLPHQLSVNAEMGALDSSGNARRESLTSRLRSLILPRVMLQDASLEEVVEYLRIRSREADPEKRGVDIVLRAPEESRSRTMTLQLADMPLDEVLRYVTEQSGTAYRVDNFAVTISSLTELDSHMVTRWFQVPPGFITNAPIQNNSAPSSPFGATESANSGMQFRRLGAKEILEQQGIPFPEGATALYQPMNSQLMVRNTVANITEIENLIAASNLNIPKQVEIQVRMIEVNETRLNELGYDWLLGQFDIPGSGGRMFASGGTVGDQASSLDPANFGFTNPGGQVIGANPITAGLRSSGNILGTPSIEGRLGRVVVPSVDSRSPGQFAVSGVFTDPQFQTVIRALNQSKGVDTLAAPNVVTKSGQRATVHVSREFIYPTEYDPPQIPQNFGGDESVTIEDGQITGVSTSMGATPILPSTPTAFEMRDVGIVLEVEPVIGPDNRTVDLNIVPSSTEFEGFIDYGTDILGSAPGPFGSIPFNVQNDILQPIFRTNKVNTSVTVWDGQTVVLGGVMQEKVSDIQDKVPVIGNIPIVGRAFSSTVTQTERKNVIFFVTVRIIDPGGKRINEVRSQDTASTIP